MTKYNDGVVKINGTILNYISTTATHNTGKEKRLFNTSTGGKVFITTDLSEAQGKFQFEFRSVPENISALDSWWNNGDANVISMTFNGYNLNGTSMAVEEYPDITTGGDNNFTVVFKGNQLTTN